MGKTTLVRLKNYVTEDNSNFSRYSEFTLEDLASSAKIFAEKHKVDLETVTFEFYSRDDDYWGNESYLTFKGWTWETDEQFEARKAKNAEDAAKARKRAADARKRKKDKEYDDYLRLKEKFEKGE